MNVINLKTMNERSIKIAASNLNESENKLSFKNENGPQKAQDIEKYNDNGNLSDASKNINIKTNDNVRCYCSIAVYIYIAHWILCFGD